MQVVANLEFVCALVHGYRISRIADLDRNAVNRFYLKNASAQLHSLHFPTVVLAVNVFFGCALSLHVFFASKRVLHGNVVGLCGLLFGNN